MNNFSYKEVYIEDGKRVLEVNILPEKYCNFDCIFCPIGRSKNKIDTQKSFDKRLFLQKDDVVVSFSCSFFTTIRKKVLILSAIYY